ncbi:MAG: hypothetical protein KBS57_06435 [Alistipes sp.]|nr:hypothetical protein [Candidatus Minthomonas equi]
MKTCPECGKNFNGRADKKFCSDECRCSYNDRLNRDRKKGIRWIDRILMKNYSILKECIKMGKTVTDVSYLLRMGFDFEYFTSIPGKCPESGSVWIACYTCFYSVTEEGEILIRDGENEDGRKYAQS